MKEEIEELFTEEELSEESINKLIGPRHSTRSEILQKIEYCKKKLKEGETQ
jgi:hypothetical protein